VRLGKDSIAVKTFGVCDFSRLAVTDWRLRRWRLWFWALMTATQLQHPLFSYCDLTFGNQTNYNVPCRN